MLTGFGILWCWIRLVQQELSKLLNQSMLAESVILPSLSHIYHTCNLSAPLADSVPLSLLESVGSVDLGFPTLTILCEIERSRPSIIDPVFILCPPRKRDEMCITA